jgi:hypothetical protein
MSGCSFEGGSYGLDQNIAKCPMMTLLTGALMLNQKLFAQMFGLDGDFIHEET